MKAQSKIISLDNGYHVWTRKVGDSPVKLLLLHGGPGMTHEYLESFADYLPDEGIEIYFYDQLGSYYSDQPDDPSLWNVDRFREEVEEVRQKLGLEDFYLLGSSWGGFLAIEYALKYQEHLKGLILSNTTASIAAYSKYINELRDKLPVHVLDKLKEYEENEDYSNPEYEALLDEHLNNKYICRLDPWPEAALRGFGNLNQQVYETLHGPNEFLVTGNYKDWNRWDDLEKITVPTLVLGAKYDSMSLEDQEAMHQRIPQSELAICENGSHLAMWDDADRYFEFIQGFVSRVEEAEK
ncbi:MAG TPA: proline iminopeptidase-family hydrolase [Pseudogracilibacillus sp.]|nr:proline iminopeptidase-family hydrolase [Pseudogracilibacillus sp.]